MESYTYVIVGGGMSAAAALRGIRELDAEGSIGLISAEPHAPYKRPPLSKKLWSGKPEKSIWMPTEQSGPTLHLQCEVQRILPETRQVVDRQGTVYGYEKLLLALGGTPRRLPWDTGDQIIYFRTLSDYRRLRALAEQGQRFAVIGGGFIGSEIAAALALNQKQVVMVFPEQGIGERIFGVQLSSFLNDYYREHGVEVLAGDLPSGLRSQAGRLVLETRQGREIAVDGVVAGIGLLPNTALAEAAGLAVDDGILVDQHLRTSDPHIYAAGDVANFYNPALHTRMRAEHEDNALAMGRCAGRNLAGAAEPYVHLPFFYSDLFELGYEAVGELNAGYELVLDWQQPFREGVIYYLHQGRVRGVLLWNVWDQLEAARRLIAEPGPFTPEALSGRLPAS